MAKRAELETRFRAFGYLPSDATRLASKRGLSRLVPQIPPTPVIRTTDDLTSLGPGTTSIRLADQSVCTLGTLRSILVQSPDLRSIESQPHLRRLFKDGALKLLSQHEVRLTFRRQVQRDQYDSLPPSEKYDTEKEVFDGLSEDESRQEELNLMRQFHALELTIAGMYYGDSRKTIIAIAEEIGIPYSSAYNRFSAFRSWMGIPTDRADSLAGAKALVHRLKDQERQEQEKQAQEAFKQQFAVDGQTPPDTLPTDRWPLWQKIMELYATYPDIVAELRVMFPRRYSILEMFFQIGEHAQIHLFEREIGDLVGISRTRVQQERDDALKELGIEAKKEKTE